MGKKRSRTKKVNTANWGQRGTTTHVAATIEVPAGKCPFLMEDSERESVLEWIAKLTEHKPTAYTYLKSVYTYWARHSFDVNSEKPDYLRVLSIIDEVIPERTSKVSDLNFQASVYLD